MSDSKNTAKDGGVTFDKYAEFCGASAFYVNAHFHDFFELNYLILGLGGEAGECVDSWKKVTRVMDADNPTQILRPLKINPDETQKLAYELGDVMWYVTHLLRVLNLSLEEIILMNTLKLWDRHGGQWEWPYKGITIKQARRIVEACEHKIGQY